VVNAFDNPRWSIPLALTVNGRAGMLKSVVIADTFRLYAVASDNKPHNQDHRGRFYPVACIEWGTEITFTVEPGQTLLPRQAPRGTWNGRKVWADKVWNAVVGTIPKTDGDRVNDVLVDELHMQH
jgi:hypothetical protein